MAKRRHKYTPEAKVSILKRHLVDKVPVSDVCDQHGLSPTVFYRCQEQFFENGSSAFISKRKSKQTLQERRIKDLEKKLTAKNEVVSELMEAHLKLKKNLGEI